jgi:hypothetical protein
MNDLKLYEPFRLFTEKRCKDLIRRATDKGLQSGETYSSTSDVRINNVSWLELDNDEYDYLWETVKDFWWTVHWYEKPIQISKYSPGEYYDWHDDAKPNKGRSSVRYLTLTCTLQSAPGAIFETEDRVYDLEPGMAVLFPSDKKHRATSPTEGERWSFTVWYMKRRGSDHNK